MILFLPQETHTRHYPPVPLSPRATVSARTRTCTLGREAAGMRGYHGLIGGGGRAPVDAGWPLGWSGVPLPSPISMHKPA